MEKNLWMSEMTQDFAMKMSSEGCWILQQSSVSAHQSMRDCKLSTNKQLAQHHDFLESRGLAMMLFVSRVIFQSTS